MEQGQGSRLRKRASRWDVVESKRPAVGDPSPKQHRLCKKRSLGPNDEGSGFCYRVSTTYLRKFFFFGEPAKQWYRTIAVPNPTTFPEARNGETIFLDMEDPGPSPEELDVRVKGLEKSIREWEDFKQAFAPSFAAKECRVLLCAVKNAICKRYKEDWDEKWTGSKYFSFQALLYLIDKSRWLPREGWRTGMLNNGKEFVITQDLLRSLREIRTIIGDISSIVVHSTSAAQLAKSLKLMFLDGQKLNMTRRVFHSLWGCMPTDAGEHLSERELNHAFTD